LALKDLDGVSTEITEDTGEARSTQLSRRPGPRTQPSARSAGPPFGRNGSTWRCSGGPPVAALW
jgi:hypothetical protein